MSNFEKESYVGLLFGLFLVVFVGGCLLFKHNITDSTKITCPSLSTKSAT